MSNHSASARTASLLLAIVAVTLLVAACAGSAATRGSSHVTVSAPTTSASRPATSAVARIECATVDLKISFVNNGATAGTYHDDLNFVNRSAHSCYVEGWPDASYVMRPGGRQVGPAAGRAQGNETRITLAPGAAAHVALIFAYNPLIGTSTKCPSSVEADWLRVYTPDQHTAAYVNLGFTAAACRNGFRTLFIGPFRPHSVTSQLP